MKCNNFQFPCKQTTKTKKFISNTNHAMVIHSKIYQLHEIPSTWVKVWTHGRQTYNHTKFLNTFQQRWRVLKRKKNDYFVKYDVFLFPSTEYQWMAPDMCYWGAPYQALYRKNWAKLLLFVYWTTKIRLQYCLWTLINVYGRYAI